MQFSRTIALLSLMLACCTFAARAQTDGNTMSLQATSDWLAATLQVYGGTDDDITVSVLLNVSIDSACTFHWTYRETDSGSPYATNYSVPLGAITSVGTGLTTTPHRSYDPGIVSLTTGNLVVIQPQGFSEFMPHPNLVWIPISRQPAITPGAAIPLNSMQMIPHIVAALQHAVNLCQGTYTPPSQPALPFEERVYHIHLSNRGEMTKKMFLVTSMGLGLIAVVGGIRIRAQEAGTPSYGRWPGHKDRRAVRAVPRSSRSLR